MATPGSSSKINQITGITSIINVTADEETSLANAILPANIIIKKASTDRLYLTDGSSRIAALTTPINSTAYYGTCATVSGSSDKTVTIKHFHLLTGTSVTIHFTYGCDKGLSPTLNVSSTGAYPIYEYGEAMYDYLESNTTYTFIFDGSYWQMVGNVYNGIGYVDEYYNSITETYATISDTEVTESEMTTLLNAM